MTVVIFAVLAQLLDMITTWWGLLHGFAEKNVIYHNNLETILIVKTLLIIGIVCLFILSKRTKNTFAFSLLIGIASIPTLIAAIGNLAMEYK